ncbi:MAG: hypothetical protein IKA63_03490 [Clostridia bacterium]|nr:hypothetical protein [Clostridia bacterium]
MSRDIKAYRYDTQKSRVYTGTAAEDVFRLPENAKGYRAYIDALYDAASTLSPAAAVEGADTVAAAMRRDVIEAPDTICATGKTYYISNHGDDNNDGLSPETAWATADKLCAMSDQLKEGDAVLFERGGEWRKHNEWEVMGALENMFQVPLWLFPAVKGVSYGAYGSGPKPILNGSAHNYADSTLWEKTEYADVYRCTEPFWNVGIVALDHSGKLGKYDEMLAVKEMVDHRHFKGVSDLRFDCSYYLDVDTKALYFCSHKGNPGERFRSIEIGGRFELIRNRSAALIDNFHFRFGGYGICGGPYANVKNCIFSYLGGCQLQAETGKFVVCGNALEIYGDCDGMYMENCWMYQICDTGFTHQQWQEKGKCIQKNIACLGNVMEYCYWSVEFNNPASIDGTERYMENYTHAYNLLRMGGYGFGGVNMDRSENGTLYNCFGTGKTINGVCEKNILNRSAGPLYRMRLEGDHAIQYRDNINIQDEGKKLAFIYDGDYPYDETAEERMDTSTIHSGGLYIYLE